MSNNNSSNSGLGLPGVLGVIFIVLKLVHVIDWSWWWILSPFWIGAAIWVLVIAVAVIAARMES
jgi:hypothetical protein